MGNCVEQPSTKNIEKKDTEKNEKGKEDELMDILGSYEQDKNHIKDRNQENIMSSHHQKIGDDSIDRLMHDLASNQ